MTGGRKGNRGFGRSGDVLVDKGTVSPDGLVAEGCPECSARAGEVEALLIKAVRSGYIDGFAVVLMAGCVTTVTGVAGLDSPCRAEVEALTPELERLVPLVSAGRGKRPH